MSKFFFLVLSCLGAAALQTPSPLQFGVLTTKPQAPKRQMMKTPKPFVKSKSAGPKTPNRQMMKTPKPFFGLVTTDYLDDKLDNLVKTLETKLIFVALFQAIVPIVIVYLIEHEKTAKVWAEVARYNQKYQARSQVLDAVNGVLK